MSVVMDGEDIVVAVPVVQTVAVAVDAPRVIAVQVYAGPPGVGAAVYPDVEAEADDAIVKGQPVYLKPNGHIALAVASGMPHSSVAGLAMQGISTGFSGIYNATGSIVQEDWSEVTGTPLLAPGSFYYLSASQSGRLTTIAPTSSAYVVPVGRAGSTTRLDIAIGYPILLT